MKFLNYDSPLMVSIRNVVDSMLVGILWIISSIPVFTNGAATTAALLTVEKCIHRDEGRIWVTYWKWFRKEFKEATLLWIIWLPIQCFAVVNIWLVSKTYLIPWVQVLVYVATGFLLCWSQLWFGYLSKFNDRIRAVLRNTFHMLLGSIGWSLLVLLNLVIHIFVGVLLMIFATPLLLFLIGSYFLCYCAIIRKIFAKYLPDAGMEQSLEEIHDEI